MTVSEVDFLERIINRPWKIEVIEHKTMFELDDEFYFSGEVSSTNPPVLELSGGQVRRAAKTKWNMAPLSGPVRVQYDGQGKMFVELTVTLDDDHSHETGFRFHEEAVISIQNKVVEFDYSIPPFAHGVAPANHSDYGGGTGT